MAVCQTPVLSGALGEEREIGIFPFCSVHQGHIMVGQMKPNI